MDGMRPNYSRLAARLALLLLLFSVISIAGCQMTGDKVASPPNDSIFPVTVTDDLGRQINLEAKPLRIVSLAPSNTEIIFYLGLGERLVGVTNYCDYPTAAQTIAKVGGYMDPSLEQVIALKPDLILATDVHQPLLSMLEQAGLKIVVIKNSNNLAEVFASISLIGRASGAEQKAEDAVKSLQLRVDRVRQKLSSLPASDKLTVYYEMWDDPYMSVGKDNLIAELIRTAGGINITDDSSEAYPQISPEIIIARSPEVMINSYGHDNKLVSAADIKARPGWQGIAFVRNERIYTVDSDILTLPGPRIVEGLEQIAACLHPELFTKAN